MDVATRGLAKMNMILHNHPTADIQQGNTLSKPLFKNKDGTLKTFDYAVANPPFSTKSWTNGVNLTKDEFGRFEGLGVPPAKNGDFAFLIHMLRSLKSTGKGAIILPHGVLFRGNSEAEIRKNIIKRGYIKGIIGLPPNLFYGTGIPACIIVLDKEDAANRKGIFMIDASKGFVKDGNKNRLREQDVHKIVDAFNKQLEIPKYSRMVPISEIADPKNDYNLNIPRFIRSQEEEDLQDIEAHLKGGIPNKDIEDLSLFWNVCPSLKNMLFVPSERPGYSILKVEQTKVKPVIFENSDFLAYKLKVEEIFESWQNRVSSTLRNLSVDSTPKKLIIDLSEDILSAFSKIELIDNYDVYQNFMSFWSETMQDDVYLIAANGWKADIHIIKNKKEKQTGWECDLIPKNLVINKYFEKEKEVMGKLTEEREKIAQQMQTLEEENSGEEDLFEEAKNDSGKITRADITRRLREIGGDVEFLEESKALQAYLDLIEKATEINYKTRIAEADLDQKLLHKYKDLTEEEIKLLVVEHKWLKSIHESAKNETERIAQKLVERIKELAERYEELLPKIAKEVEERSQKVDNHLKNMGFKW
jgi:type I restriction enzyme M protein